MTIHAKPYAVKKAVLHLAGEAILTKNDQASPLEAIARKFGDHVATTMEKLGATNGEIEGIKAQLMELEQKMVRPRGSDEGAREPSIGERFIQENDLKSFAESQRRGSFSVNLKTTVTSGATSGGSLGRATRDATLMMQQRRLRVRDLIPQIPVTDGSVEYPAQTSRPSAAASVAEGALKPESALTFQLKTVPIRTIAHWIPASRQILSDVPQLQGIIDSELLYGLALVEENQLLFGGGTGEDLLGMTLQATAFSAPYSIASATSIDMLAQAIAQLAITNFEVDGAIVNTADWWRMKTTKDAGGNYIIGNPQGTTGDNLWGIPVVPTTAMTIDKFLVGNFQQAATIYDRWVARVEVSTEDADNFRRNLVTVLAEERIGLAVKKPAGLVFGDFGLVA